MERQRLAKESRWEAEALGLAITQKKEKREATVQDTAGQVLHAEPTANDKGRRIQGTRRNPVMVGKRRVQRRSEADRNASRRGGWEERCGVEAEIRDWTKLAGQTSPGRSHATHARSQERTHKNIINCA